MVWEVDLVLEVQEWLDSLDSQTYDRVLAALDLLREEGPSLGRPMVDTVKGSQFANMKELRPPAPGRLTIRVLFIFDPDRHAILLVGGDKTNDWDGWYKRNIPLAEARYIRHLKERDKNLGAKGKQDDNHA